MTPVLLGRIQTRLFVIATVGVLWTLIVTAFLPARGSDLAEAYSVTYRSLLIVAAFGLVWECIYHFLQQFRWEKDWPTLFGLLTGINEGVSTWLLMAAFVVPVRGVTFVVYFATTWIVMWLWVNGPMKVPFLRWRYRGGRLL